MGFSPSKRPKLTHNNGSIAATTEVETETTSSDSSTSSTTTTLSPSASSSLSSYSAVAIVSAISGRDVIEHVTSSSAVGQAAAAATLTDDGETIKAWECYAEGIFNFSSREEVSIKKQQSTLQAVGLKSTIGSDDDDDDNDGSSMNDIFASGTPQQQSEYPVVVTNNIFDKRKNLEKCRYVVKINQTFRTYQQI